jgi:hypothetical protein
MKKITLLILIILLGTIILGLSLPAQAAILDEIDDPCNLCVFAVLISNIKNYALTIAGPITVLMIIIGGVMITVSGGQENLRAQGKKTLTGGIIGLIIVLLAWVIVTSILVATLGVSFSGNLWTVSCPADSSCQYSSSTTPGSDDDDPSKPSGEFGGSLSGSQAGAASSLSTFLTCFEKYIPQGQTWTITSVVDNTHPECTPQNDGNPLGCSSCICGKTKKHCPISNCSDCSSYCSHSKNSCHYGGTCKDGSYAVDLDRVGQSAPAESDVKYAAQQCGGAFVYPEGTHIHMSIGNYQGNTCDCN